jgi:DNA-binding transcriptional LysR family regulator
MVVIAPRTTHLRGAVDLTALPDVRWVVNPEGCACRAALRRLYAAAGSPFNVAVEVHGSAMQVELVAAGLGYGLIPAHALNTHLRRHAVTVLPMKKPLLSFGIWIVTAPVTPLLKGAVELMVESIGGALQNRNRRRSPRNEAVDVRRTAGLAVTGLTFAVSDPATTCGQTATARTPTFTLGEGHRARGGA